MFANRDARNKLAGMGGILSSSPELMGATQQFEPGGRVLMGAAGMPEPQGPGIMSSLGNAIGLNDQQREKVIQAYMNPSFQTPEFTGLEEFQQAQPISAEVSNQMRVIDMAKGGASVKEIAQNVGLSLLDTANIIAGTASLLVTEGAALAADVAGLVSGGGELSKGAFGVAQDLRDFGQDSYAPPEGSDNNAYRLFNQIGLPEETADLSAQIEEDSLRAIAAGDDALFAEGAPVEQLGGDLPSSIIQARTMDPPLVDDFGLESMAPFSDNRELNFDAPMGDTASESMLSPDPLERFDTSTGVPMNMDEVEQSVFRERSDAADAGLTNIAEPVDRFPQEDLRRAEQEAELFDIRNRSLSDNERLQMTPYEDPPIATPNTAAAESMIEAIEAANAQAEVDGPEVDGPEVDGPEVDGPSGVNLGDLDADITDNPGDAGALTSGALLRSAGVDTSNMGIQERTVAMRDMLNDLMGQTDADEKEEFWMNMAMVGFGIAAGESSDAMKNIADGLLAGTAQITKGNADKRARNDSLTTLAFGEVLADERAREKFGRDLQLATARGTDSIYGKRKDPLSQMYQLADTLYADGAGDFTTFQDALDAARTQVGLDYELDLGAGGGGDDTGAGTHAERNAAAKSAGQTQYVGPDGNNYKVQ
tara:strand:- start:3078 stop:5027 length:1950 start_codon:yes stop_codon:yes gene_type:complete